MTTTFCVSGAALKKAGINVNPYLSSGAILLSGSNFIVDTWINESESEINVSTEKNWTDAYAALNPDVKNLLNAAASDRAAMRCIQYDMSGYTSRAEAVMMLNVLRDAFNAEVEILKRTGAQSFITGA